MPKLPFSNKINVSPKQAVGILRFWKDIQAGPVKEIAEQAERPFHLALVGTPDHTRLLAARLALETTVPKDSKEGPVNISSHVSFHLSDLHLPKDSLRLDANALTADDTLLAGALARIVVAHPDIRLSLARYVPAFRPAVVSQIISEDAWGNAKIATLSAIPGIIPFTDALLPVTAMGDMLLLTKNQGLMLLRIAAAYGLPIDLRARTKELLPVVGSAFGWRAIARELVGIVPGGIGVLLKGSIAYAGTYAIGKAAQIYYSTGQTLSAARMQQLGKDAARDARVRLQAWLQSRGRGGSPAMPEEIVDKSSPVKV